MVYARIFKITDNMRSIGELPKAVRFNILPGVEGKYGKYIYGIHKITWF